MTDKILITDGRALSALAIARSLGTTDAEIHVCDEFRLTVSAFSKYVTEMKVHEPISESPQKFIEWLMRCCRREGYDLVVPVRDETTLAVAEHRERLSAVTSVFVADRSTITRMMDKGSCMQAAEKLDVPIPTTYYPDGPAAIEEIQTAASFPVLIKPRIASGSRGIVRVDEPNELPEKYDAVSQAHAEPIIQEFVDHAGGHYSIGTIFDDSSEPVATHVYKETRQYPASGGPAIAAHTVEKEPWIDSALDLLEAHDWKGPAHMDVLYDPDTDEYRLIEVNPRFWSSLALTINSGVDIPYLLYKMAVDGNTPASDGEYRVGMNYRWVVPNELLWLWSHDRKRKAIRELGSWDDNTCCATLSRDDLRPTLGVLAQGVDYLKSADRRKKIFDRGWSN